MWPRTAFLGKLIGLYCILISLAMFAHKQATIEAATTLVHDPGLMLAVGVVGVAAGLAMVLGHNIWSGGALPFTVTLVGWLLLAKSLFLLFLSEDAAAALFLGWLHYEQLFYPYATFSLLLGVYLTYAASKAHPR